MSDDQLFMLDSLKDMVRLGAGLGADKTLSQNAIDRAVDCLRKFGERLRGFDPHSVRAVATNTFRIAKNSAELLQRSQEALGFPIEIIAGREEARMIFIGVSHSLPPFTGKRMVMDIGGGSTEFVIGQAFEPTEMESLYMGCVSYSMRFFADGKFSENNFQQAEIAARTEIQTIRRSFSVGHWDEAVGSSGSARALGQIMQVNGWSDGSITRTGLIALKKALIKTKDFRQLQLPGLSDERAAVIAGGYSIMAAAFAELQIEQMTVAGGALREGVLYELLGRIQHHDTREATVRQFMRRYHVDGRQARRVQATAIALIGDVAHALGMEIAVAQQFLIWAARLHEIGVSIAHSSYHKHSAYIVENADMPGFSTMEQQLLGLLLRSQRRSLAKLPLPALEDDRIVLMVVLRLAVLFHRNRMDTPMPQIALETAKSTFTLVLPKEWLNANPLTETELKAELAFWSDAGLTLKIKCG